MRLGKRERQNKNQMAILKALQGARARMVQGEKILKTLFQLERLGQIGHGNGKTRGGSRTMDSGLPLR